MMKTPSCEFDGLAIESLAIDMHNRHGIGKQAGHPSFKVQA